ncbi:ISAzo13 family transposase [Methyloprofundus sp.]|uniref:ISAzo13 family transposase n=1 Tax=Methyloprofundus sp. TaxID=2020875 RepID=UPI003D0FE2BC
MILTDSIIGWIINTAHRLKGSVRRIFMAETVELLGSGGASIAEEKLGWNRGTIRKGQYELETQPIEDNFSARGRNKSEEHFPHLLDDIKKIAEPECQTDPSFNSCRLYTRLTAKEVRKRLLEIDYYDEKTLPCSKTINTKLNDLSYHPKKVQKTKPHKKIKETDAIFEQVHAVNGMADINPKEIRISIDAKARMNIGNFSRGGRNRVLTKAEDHDLDVKEKLTPFGFYLPEHDDFFLFFTAGYASSDFIVDRLEEIWPEIQEKYGVDILNTHADNGMENSSSRTQFIKRLVEFAEKSNIKIKLAYYPPYHSKYNPIERVWGAYENHISGDIMDTVETTLKFAKSMTYNGKAPIVKLTEKIYETGVKVGKKAMKTYYQFVDRMPSLEKWFLTISPGCSG